MHKGGSGREDLPPWLIEAERTYLISQALPGFTLAEIGEIPSYELDKIIQVGGVYRAVFNRGARGE